MNIGYLVSRIGPYHDARFRAVSDLGIVAIEMFSRDVTYSWATIPARPYNNLTLFESELAAPSIRQYRNAIASAVKQFKIDVLAVPGWSAPWALVATEFAIREGIPVILLSDTHRLRSNSFFEAYSKRSLVSAFSAALTAGSPHQRYLHSLGMTSAQTFDGYDVVDNLFFSDVASSSILQGPYILCVARLVWEKNLDALLHEYARCGSRQTHKLVLAGDGPDRARLQLLADRLGISASVYFIGFVSYPVVRALYRHADVFVLPSKSETWGLSVNEAMASSLPVLVSNACGCAEDLVKPGWNGEIIFPEISNSIADALDAILSSPYRETMGKRSLEIIENWGLPRFRTGFLNATKAALAHKKFSMADRLFRRVVLRAALNKF